MPLHPEAQDRNERLAALAPHVLEALSPLGLRSFFPKGIPFQAAQAKDCAINATIGQITDGHGNPLVLAPLGEKLASLEPRDAFLYSPIQGREPARKAWHAKLSAEDPRMAGVALGQVTAGICHALSMAAELFFTPGDTLVLPDLYWDNYDQIFQVRLEAEVATFPFYGPEGGFHVAGLADTLAKVPGKVHVLLNFPSNPSGYSPTPEELGAIADVLARAAQDRPVVVYVDDAYHGLVFEETATPRSLFFELLDRSPRLIPVKCDGITKELSFFGSRVGFLHLGVAPAVGDLLVDKLKGLMRAGAGGPVGLSQHLMELELADPRHASEVAKVKAALATRYQVLKAALAEPSPHWKVLPFNAGCFCLLELAPGLDAETVRQTLIREEGVGVVSQGNRHLRIAFCSLEPQAIPPLVQALARTCGRLA